MEVWVVLSVDEYNAEAVVDSVWLTEAEAQARKAEYPEETPDNQFFARIQRVEVGVKP